MNHLALPMLSRTEARQRLEARGVLATRQRLDIARVMLAKPQHVSADQLMELVNRAGSHVSKATVYNTLRLFTERGIVREVLVDPTRVFYDSNTSEHHHLYNEDTGDLSDLTPSLVKVQVEDPSDLPQSVAVSGVDVIVRVRNRR